MSYVHDILDLTPEMTSNTTSSPASTCAASASSEYTTYQAWKAFDHVPSPLPVSSSWLTFNLPTPEAPQWIQFDFGTEDTFVINEYKITNMGSAAGVGDLNNPRDWFFQGCLGGDNPSEEANWVTLDSQADISWVVDETKDFTFSNNTAYRYYRVCITDYNPYSYTFLAIGEIELFGHDASLPVTNPWAWSYSGYSSNTKPTGAPEGSRFYEKDTLDVFLVISGVWTKISSSGGGTGPTGPTGAQGTAGTAGADSTVTGPTGPTGAQGTAGTAGAASTVTGPTGPTGAQGTAGTAGATGPTGAQGTAGTAGATGPTGPTGSQGTAGTAGAAGGAGPTGATGPTWSSEPAAYTTGPTGVGVLIVIGTASQAAPTASNYQDGTLWIRYIA